MRCSEVVIVGSAKPPRVPGLSVDDKYCEGIISSGATLVLAGTIVIAAGHGNSKQKTQAQQKADDEIL